jgi:4-amino-4-deoxy-L-arabinose transferase-like glycosyltransferase
LGVLLVAAALRLPGIRFGLPAQLHPDEPFLFASARQLRSGGAITHRIGASYPPLYVRLLAVQQSLAAAIAGAEPRDPTLFVLGRGLTLLLSLIGVGLGYALARDLAGAAAGLWAAALLAVNPVLVEHARYMTVDTGVTVLVLATFLLALRGLDRPGPSSVAAFLVGLLAVATKYNAVLVLLVPLYVQVRGCGANRRCLARQLALSGAAALLVFWLLATRYQMFQSLHVPYTISGRFLEKEHAFALLSLGDNVRALLFGAAGALPAIAAGLLVSPRLPASLYQKLGLVAAWLAAYILLMSLFPFAGVRQLLPGIALASVVAGVLVSAGLAGASRTGTARWRDPLLTAGAVVVLLLPPAARAAAAARILMRDDTRLQTVDWFRRHAVPGSVVLVEYDAVEFLTGDDGRPLPFRPVVVPSLRDLDAASRQAGEARYLVADGRARGGYFDGPRGPLRGFVLQAALPSHGRPGPERAIFAAAGRP